MGLHFSKNKEYEECLENLDTAIKNMQISVRKDNLLNAICWGNKYFLTVSFAIWLLLNLLIDSMENIYFLFAFILLYLCKMRMYKVVKWRQKQMVDKLLKRKSQVLEEVKEKVTYNKAKPIIEKFEDSLNKPEPLSEDSQRSLQVTKTKSNFFKIGAVLLGESPSNQKDLKCSQCQYICGQVHKEEYPFVAYNCLECGFHNEPLMVRPIAPKL